MNLVSIVMPVYNGEKYLTEAIESVLKQIYNNFELICIDDGSTDRSKEIILSFKDKRIRYVYQENSGSPAKGRNRGLTLSNGAYIAFIDQDDIYLSNSLSEKIKLFSDNPGINFVYSDCAVIDEDGNKIADSMIASTNKIPLSGKCFKELFLGNFIPIQGVMVEKKVFDKVGVFNESLIGTDDYEMWLRIAYHYPITYLNKILAMWRKVPTSLSHNQHKMDENLFKCLESIFNLFSGCDDIVGHKNVKKRMYALSVDVAYGYLSRGEQYKARYWLKKSWSWGRNPKSITQILLTYLFPFSVAGLVRRSGGRAEARQKRTS